MHPIPVVDLFAGAGGLGEGFACPQPDGGRPFMVRLSIEANSAAHQTLELRSFFRSFDNEEVPDGYYDHLRGALTRAELFETYPDNAQLARREAWLATLGPEGPSEVEIDSRIEEARAGAGPRWVLVGGPPCQAYSLAGRSRNQAKPGYRPEDDHRHFLYREYLRILRRHRPDVFVMENVKGVLSARVEGESIFRRMIRDLEDPDGAFGESPTGPGYRIYPLAHESRGFDLFGESENPHREYIVECERFGIPQRRHRVLLLGVRHDIRGTPGLLTPVQRAPTAEEAISDLPKLRAGLTGRGGRKAGDMKSAWLDTVGSVLDAPWLRVTAKDTPQFRRTKELVRRTAEELRAPRSGQGAEWLRTTSRKRPVFASEWFLDDRLDGVCNHSARGHMSSDLHRYLWAACFAQANSCSPRLRDFPEELRPKHRNVGKSLDHDNFSDRFKVQLAGEPSATVMSHIAKDGHYYIHFDPAQCRSLTVREAARLQTFPDNFVFCGTRTEQYMQVGNAVPPLIARQIASIVGRLVADPEERHGRPDLKGKTQREHVQDPGKAHGAGAHSPIPASQDGPEVQTA